MTHDKAIYLLRNASWLGSNETREQTEIAVQMAVKALEIFKQSEWIPCSERLPIPNTNILFCTDTTTTGEGRYEGFDGIHEVGKMYAICGTFWNCSSTHGSHYQNPISQRRNQNDEVGS